MSYSRRQLYAMGEPLGECVTRKEGGRIIYGGGDSAPATQTQVSDLPDWAKPYAQKALGMTEGLTDISKNPYQAYGGPRTAQFTDLQKQAYGNVAGLNAGPQGFAQNVGAYMSPYMQNVVDREKMAAARDSQILGQQQQAGATQAGAFGGYREGIQRAERERGLRSSLQDIQARGTQAAYDQAASQFRQGINQQLAVSQQQGAFGTQQQQNVQNMLDTQYQDFLNQKRYPYQQLEFMSNMLRGTPMGTVNTLYGAGPTSAQTIGALGMGMYGYNQMFGGKNAADGGIMESYAEGGVTSDQNVESILDNLSVEQLKQSRQIAVANGDRARVEMIDDELAQRASEARGMSAAFNQLPAESQGAMFEAANGGVVAFADRGLVKAPEFTLPDYKKMYDEAIRLSGELPNTMYTAPTQAQTIEGIRAQRGLVQEMMGPDKTAPFLEELTAKRQELKGREGQSRGLAALAAAGEMLQGSGLGSVGKGIAKFGSEVGRLNKENEEADRLLLASQVQLASAQQARADGQFDKATTLYKSAEDLRVKALDAKRDVLGKQASLQATMAGQGLTAATSKYTAELNAKTSRDVEAMRGKNAMDAANKPGERERILEKLDRIRTGKETFGGKSGEDGAKAYIDSLGDVGEAIMGARYKGTPPNPAQLENAITAAIDKDPEAGAIKLRLLRAKNAAAKYTPDKMPADVKAELAAAQKEALDLRAKHEARVRAAMLQNTGGADSSAAPAPAASAPVVRARP
jgi:hypothetical protein